MGRLPVPITLHMLPREILLTVFSYLDVKDLIDISLVDRTFEIYSNETAEEILKRLAQTSLYPDVLLHRQGISAKRVLHVLSRRMILFAGGGSDSNDVGLIMDPASKQFVTRCKQLENPELLFKLVYFKGVALALTSVVTSNHNEPFNQNNNSDLSAAPNTIQKYDFFSNRWEPFTCFPRRLRGVATAVLEDKLYVMGGFDKDQSIESDSVYVLEGKTFASSQWSLLPSRLNTPRSGHSAVTYRGRIIVAGGRPSSDADNLRSVEAFNPATNLWEFLPPMIKPRYLLSLLVVKDCLYAVGGCSGSGTIERYDAENKRWEYVTRIRNKRLYSSAVSVDDKIYVFGGVDEAYRFEATWDGYNTTSCCWDSEIDAETSKRSLPWDKFTYGQSILVPPAPLSWT